MDARLMRAALVAAVLLVSMGARYRTPNFIVETADDAFCQKAATTAEKLRRDLAVEWLGQAMRNWSQPCVMTIQVGANMGAGGATSFVFDRGEVFGWRMTIQGSQERLLDSVLPHEITHMIFATHFRRPLPRWADEGGATNVECASERMKHRTMLVQFLRTGRGIAFDKMFDMTEYPRDVMPLYAQGHSLADYLIQQGGRREFVNFMTDAMKDDDWVGAIRRHYGNGDLGILQNDWLAWVRQGSPQIGPRHDQLAAVSPAKTLADRQRRPRPEPNLIYYVPKRPSTASPENGGRLLATESGDSPLDLTGSTPEGEGTVATRSASGWHAPGDTSAQPKAVAAAPLSAPAPQSNQVARPQPLQLPQTIAVPACSSGG